jgi:hypothetical protein
MPEDKRSGSFWTTLPGILSGAAALLTAVASVAALLHRDRADDPPATRPQQMVTTAERPASPPGAASTASVQPDANGPQSATASTAPATPDAIAARVADPVLAASLGAAAGDEVAATSGGRLRDFDNGSVYWHPRTGAFTVQGAIRDKFRAVGATAFGFPVTDELPTPDGVGRFNHFVYFYPNGFAEARSIYWRPDLGAHTTQGLIRAHWEQSGWEAGPLGYPISDEYQAGTQRRQDFEHGHILWSIPTGAQMTVN